MKKNHVKINSFKHLSFSITFHNLKQLIHYKRYKYCYFSPLWGPEISSLYIHKFVIIDFVITVKFYNVQGFVKNFAGTPQNFVISGISLLNKSCFDDQSVIFFNRESFFCT